MDKSQTKVIGVRFPIELIEWIDHYSRIAALKRQERVTRNSVIIEFIEIMKIYYSDKHES